MIYLTYQNINIPIFPPLPAVCWTCERKIRKLKKKPGTRIISSVPILGKQFQESWIHELFSLRRANKPQCGCAVRTEMTDPRQWFGMNSTTLSQARTHVRMQACTQSEAQTRHLSPCTVRDGNKHTKGGNKMWNIWEMIQLAAENQSGSGFMITDADHRITWTQRQITFFMRWIDGSM